MQKPTKSPRGLRQVGGQAKASLPLVPSRQSSALAMEHELLIQASAILDLLLKINKRERDSIFNGT
jgi:hypothetical protein